MALTRSILVITLSILAAYAYADQSPKLVAVFSALSRAAQETNLPQWLVFNVAHAESSFRPECVTRQYGRITARGLMQINPRYQDELVVKYLAWNPSRFDWSNPDHSAKLGCHYLSSLIKRFGMWKGVAAYNVGPGHRLNEWPMHRSLPDETWEYCHRIFTRA